MNSSKEESCSQTPEPTSKMKGGKITLFSFHLTDKSLSVSQPVIFKVTSRRNYSWGEPDPSLDETPMSQGCPDSLWQEQSAIWMDTRI